MSIVDDTLGKMWVVIIKISINKLGDVGNSSNLIGSLSLTNEQLFTEVDSWIYWVFLSTLRWIITLTLHYITTNQWISEVKKLQSLNLYRILKFVNKLGSWQLFRVSDTISASLVKLKRRTMFKNRTLPWKTPKLNFVAFFVLIGIALSFISEIWASLKPSGNWDAMLSISCAVMRARNILGYS